MWEFSSWTEITEIKSVKCVNGVKCFRCKEAANSHHLFNLPEFKEVLVATATEAKKRPKQMDLLGNAGKRQKSPVLQHQLKRVFPTEAQELFLGQNLESQTARPTEDKRNLIAMASNLRAMASTYY